MTNGALFDLQVLGAVAVAAWAVYVTAILVRYYKDRDRPVDWEKDYPEYLHAKETHVKVVDD